MGRTPILTKLSSEIRVENSRENRWLVDYSFSGSKPNPFFFDKIGDLTSNLLHEGAYADKSRRSIFMTNDLHGAVVAVKLAKHYGADVRLYKVEEMDLENTIKPDYEFRLEKDEVDSVRKAVRSNLRELAKKQMKVNNDTNQLTTFLWVTENGMRPDLPLRKRDIEKVLEQTSYLEDGGRDSSAKTSFGLDLDNVVLVMKAVEEYLEENKQTSFEDVTILFNVLNRLTGYEEAPFEPSKEDIQELLLESPAEKLADSLRKSRIVHEIL